MKIPIFPVKYHQNGGFSMAMLVYRRVHPDTKVEASSSSRSIKFKWKKNANMTVSFE